MKRKQKQITLIFHAYIKFDI